MAIEEILDLEKLEVNIYRGGVYHPESGYLSRTFGGHIAGQALVSAVRTVDPRYRVHLCCTATSCGPVTPPNRPSTWSTGPATGVLLHPAGRCRPERRGDLLDGRLIPDRAVRYRASGRHARGGATGQPLTRTPKTVSRNSPSGTSAGCPRLHHQALPGKVSQQQVWFKHRDRLPDDPLLHICALAYMSDLTCSVPPRSPTRRTVRT